MINSYGYEGMMSLLVLKIGNKIAMGVLSCFVALTRANSTTSRTVCCEEYSSFTDHVRSKMNSLIHLIQIKSQP